VGWTSPRAWDANGSRVELIDMNGDGLPDRVIRHTGFGEEIEVQLNAGPFPDLLSGVQNGFGGSVQVTYQPSTKWDNSDGTRPRLPFPVYAVQNVTVNDGNNNIGTTSYTFKGGFYDTSNREFRGFGYSHETDPYGLVTERYFHQGGGINASSPDAYQDSKYKAGMAFLVQEYGSDGFRYKKTVNKVDQAQVNASTAYFPFISQTTVTDSEAGATRISTTLYSYDHTTGNLLEESDLGAGNTAAIFKIFTYIPVGNIKNLPQSITISADQAGTQTGILRQTTYEYNGSGNVLKQHELICPGTYADTSFLYDGLGNEYSKTDPAGITTTTVYDTATQTFPVQQTTGGFTENRWFDARSGSVTGSIDIKGLVTTNFYDGLYRLTETLVSTVPQGTPTVWRVQYQYSFGINSFVRELKNEPANTSTGYQETIANLDGFGQVTHLSVQDELGHYRKVDFTYNKRGQITFETFPYFSNGSAKNSIFTAYDPIGRANQTGPSVAGDTGSPLGPVQTAFRDGGNPFAKVITDPAGKVKKYLFADFGRQNQIVEVTAAGSYNTYFAYDQAGNLTNITDNLANKTSLYYDGLGEKVAVADPNTGLWLYGHDKAGRLTVQTDAKGQQLKLYYNDPLGRVSRKDDLNAAGQVVASATFQYDQSDDPQFTVLPGQLYAVYDSEGWQKYSYDVRGRILKTARMLNANGQTYITSYTYDNADRVQTMTYPGVNGPTVQFTYDIAGHLSQVQRIDTGGAQIVYYTTKGFDEFNRPIGANLGNGTTTDLTYYPLSSRLKQITTKLSGGAQIQNLAYTFDVVGNLAGLTDGVHTWAGSGTISSLQYDDLYRLTSVAGPGIGSQSFSYNSIGNILVNGEAGAGTYNYGTARPQMVKSANGQNYTYDLNGNMVFRNGQTLAYDVRNRLVKADTGGVPVTFGYAEDGARLWERGSNGLQVWIGNYYEEKGGKILYHIVAGEHLVCTFEPAAAGVSGYDPASQEFYYYHPDELGSSSLLTERNGAQVQHYEYSAFGRDRFTDNTGAFAVSRRYTGQVLDTDTGLYYYNYRYYDPQLARFIQPDDIIPDPSNPQSYNLYSYVLNNPLRYADPSGHWGKEVADWWSARVNTAAEFYTAGSSHWIWNGTVETANSLIGGLADPLRLGSDAGRVSAEGGSAGKILVTTFQEGSRVLAVLPVGAAIGKGVGAAANRLASCAEREAAGELTGIMGGCFVAGTLVRAENGNVEIQNVKVGDRVWSYSFQAGKWELREVEATPVRDYSGDVITIGLDDVAIEATGNHPFWVMSGDGLVSRPPAVDVPEEERNPKLSGRWVEARSLKTGDVLLLVSGETSAISGLSEREEHVQVYNLRVEGNHTYAVSRVGVLVHNKAAQVKPVPKEGIYEFPDKQAPGRTYVGQSGQLPKRIRNHEKLGRKAPESEASITEVPGGKTKRELQEQRRIDELGGTRDKTGSKTSNQRNPVSQERRKQLDSASP
jgi:RHS repeat-associated protein